MYPTYVVVLPQQPKVLKGSLASVYGGVEEGRAIAISAINQPTQWILDSIKTVLLLVVCNYPNDCPGALPSVTTSSPSPPISFPSLSQLQPARRSALASRGVSKSLRSYSTT